MSAPRLLPGVEVDSLSRAFFDGAAEGRLLLQRCRACAALQLGSVLCQSCGNGGFDWIEASRKATVHTFTTMHVAYGPAFDVPYRAAVVELEEGPRLQVFVVDGAPVLHVGQAVSIEFAPAEGANHVPVARVA